MRHMFYYVSELNNAISSWDVSSVTFMFYILFHVSPFNNNNKISYWNVSSVTRMENWISAYFVFIRHS